MKIAHLLAAVLLACIFPARAAEVRTQTYVVGVDVNAQGDITQTQVEASVDKSIASVLDAALRQWQFEPARKDGRAAAAHTFINTRLDAIPDASGNYTLHISYISHGPRWDTRPPTYPGVAIRRRESGIVIIEGTLQPDGTLSISGMQTTIEGGRGDSALTAASKDWFVRKAVLPETVEGMPVAADIRAFTVFSLNPYYGNTNAPDAPSYSAREIDFLQQAGFMLNGKDGKFLAPDISSVLKTRKVNPVTMRL